MDYELHLCSFFSCRAEPASTNADAKGQLLAAYIGKWLSALPLCCKSAVKLADKLRHTHYTYCPLNIKRRQTAQQLVTGISLHLHCRLCIT